MRYGRVAEWSIAPVLKTGNTERCSRVRIPALPLIVNPAAVSADVAGEFHLAHLPALRTVVVGPDCAPRDGKSFPATILRAAFRALHPELDRLAILTHNRRPSAGNRTSTTSTRLTNPVPPRDGLGSDKRLNRCRVGLHRCRAISGDLCTYRSKKMLYLGCRHSFLDAILPHRIRRKDVPGGSKGSELLSGKRPQDVCLVPVVPLVDHVKPR
jgi:hypothetical protein